jgi:hypothetical protein
MAEAEQVASSESGPPEPLASVDLPRPSRPPRRLSLRLQFFIGLILVLGLPLLATGLSGLFLLSRREDQAAIQALGNIAVAVARQVDGHLGDHLDVLRELAIHGETSPGGDLAALGPVLARVHAIHPEFLTMISVDRSGLVRASAPTLDREGHPFLAKARRVEDREYFKVPMESGKAFVSGIFRGRGIGTEPVVAVAAPVVLDGQAVGLVEASLDVSRIPILEGLASPAPVEVVILDARDRVVLATRGSGYEPLQELGAAPIGQLLHAGEDGPGRYQAEGVTWITAAAPIPNGGWHVLIESRADAVRASTRRYLATVLTVMAAGLALAVLLAAVLARWATRPLERLEGSVRGFLSGQATAPLQVSRWAPREVASLVEGYDTLQRRVGSTLSGLLPVCAWCRRIRDPHDHWQSLEIYVRDHSEAEVTHGICPDCERRAVGGGT